MKKIIAFVLAFSFQQVFAENDEILRCTTESNQFFAIVVVDSIGVGLLKFQRKDKPENKYSCALRLAHVADNIRGATPQQRFVFRLSSCDPELKSLESEILKTQTLLVDLQDEKNPKALYQWLRSSQPENCLVKKFNLFATQVGAKKWKEGNWGRLPAAAAKKKLIEK